MRNIIHVNQFKVRDNNKNGTDEPVLTIKTYKNNQYAHEAIVRLPDGTEVGRFVYQPENPLSCGAKVWFVTYLDVEIVNRSEHD
jgi:hypothetical protein